MPFSYSPRHWQCLLFFDSLDYASHGRKDIVRSDLYQHYLQIQEIRASKKWDELSTAEVESAYELCYFKEVWDGMSLGTW